VDSLYGVTRDAKMLRQAKEQAQRSKNNSNHYTRVGKSNVYKNSLGWTLTRIVKNGSITFIGGDNGEVNNIIVIRSLKIWN